ncbi:MAG: hypothetical protein JWM25_1454 [Thermoleophilia bacterium]|nr:hypothetical protein [Thermoleophilia bacterium]MCZ4496871.1 hypothetical protein [Thermoleophilia bacterium]
MNTKLTPAQVLRLRLQAQSLVASPHSTAAEVVQSMLALQGQDFAASHWAVGVRAPGATRKDVYAAYDAGEIIRSWPMRGTLHVVAPRDLGWMLELTTERLLHGIATRWRQLGIDDAHLERARSAARALLDGGGRATRAQFIRALEEAGVDSSGQRGYHTIWFLAQTGTICWGPMVDDQQALVLLDEWVPNPRKLDGSVALGEFLRRYLSGHGPATLKDFAWWAKLTMRDARTALEAVRDELVEVHCGELDHWMLAEAAATLDPDLPAARQSVRALPSFDEHLLGYQNRNLQLDPEHADLIVPGGNGIFRPTIVVGGQVRGTWSRTKRADGTDVSVEAFAPLATRTAASCRRSVRDWSTFNDTAVRIELA